MIRSVITLCIALCFSALYGQKTKWGTTKYRIKGEYTVFEFDDSGNIGQDRYVYINVSDTCAHIDIDGIGSMYLRRIGDHTRTTSLRDGLLVVYNGLYVKGIGDGGEALYILIYYDMRSKKYTFSLNKHNAVLIQVNFYSDPLTDI